MKKKKRDIRIVFILFSVIIAMIARKLYPLSVSYIFTAASIGLALCALFFPMILLPLFNFWIKVAHIIGKFNTQVLLLMVFILFFVPVGIILRILKKDSMKRQTLPVNSYWGKYELTGLKDRSHYEKQF